MKFEESVHWDENFHKLLIEDNKKEDLNLLIEIHEHWADNINLDGDNYSDFSKRNLLQSFSQ